MRVDSIRIFYSNTYIALVNLTSNISIPLEPRRLLLFLSPKTVNKKSVPAESASLKIGNTTLKVRNLSAFHSDFKQTDFLRFVPPIFLTLTSQGGNQGILRSASYLLKRSQKFVFAEMRDRHKLIQAE